jgi:hypothetical protein
MAEDSAPLSYARIENAMRDAVNQMGEFTHTFAGAADDAAIAEAEFKVAFAKSRLQARAAGDHEGRKITESYADDLAMVATENERMRMEQTKAKYDATRQALLSVRSRIEALRSLMTSHREAGG